jgi:hypothetical protein
VVTPRQAVVGSPMRLRVTVLVETWFTSAPDYPSFELAGLVVREPADNSFNVRERIGGVSYSGIVREYLLYPQSAASYVVDGQVVRVHYAHPETRKPVHIARTLAPIRFEASVPAAARELDPFVATRRLTLEQTLAGDVDAPAVGGAITRTIEVTVSDLPSMFVPPLLPDSAPSGLRAYASSPETEDIPGRQLGRSTGSRIETMTYVIEEPGDYELPPVRLRWWNRRTGTIETAEAAAFTFSVAAPPEVAELTGTSDVATEPGTRFVLLVALVSTIGLALANRRRLQRLPQEWRASAARRAQSEPVRFKQLSHAVGRAQPGVIYRRLAAWLQAIEGGPVEIGSLVMRPGCEALARSVVALERDLYAEGEHVVGKEERAMLRAALRQARSALLGAKGVGATRPTLPDLNPTAIAR